LGHRRILKILNRQLVTTHISGPLVSEVGIRFEIHLIDRFVQNSSSINAVKLLLLLENIGLEIDLSDSLVHLLLEIVEEALFVLLGNHLVLLAQVAQLRLPCLVGDVDVLSVRQTGIIQRLIQLRLRVIQILITFVNGSFARELINIVNAALGVTHLRDGAGLGDGVLGAPEVCMSHGVDGNSVEVRQLLQVRVVGRPFT